MPNIKDTGSLSLSDALENVYFLAIEHVLRVRSTLRRALGSNRKTLVMSLLLRYLLFVHLVK